MTRTHPHLGAACLVFAVSITGAARSVASEPPVTETQGTKPPPSESGTLDDICKIDPQACPKVDLGKEARAPSIEKVYAVGQVSSITSIASKSSRRLVLPAGFVELGGEMAFITSNDAILTNRALKFTDVGLLRLRARRAFSDWFELYLGTELLAKQPSDTHGSILQGVTAGALAEFKEGYASSFSASLGPLFTQTGWWLELGPDLTMKPIANRYMRFVLDAGNKLTLVHFDQPTPQKLWLEEIRMGGEVQLGDDRASMWVGLDYRVPYASGPSGSSAWPGFDPLVRLNVQVGGLLSLGRDDFSDWDAFATYSVIDHGEASHPGTYLPILDGGFDQVQITVGVQHRFGPKPTRSSNYL